MKKKRWDAFPSRESIPKFIRVMKLMSFFLLAGFLEVSANVYSQQANIHLSMHDVRLDEVIKEIQKQTEYTFFYSPDDVTDVIISKVELEKASIESTLDQCLKGTNLDYEIVHKAVVLKKGKEPVVVLPNIPTLQQPLKKEISGTVKDSKGLPLPGVTVIVKGTTLGTITDVDGQFGLSVPADAKTLVFSFIGMKSQEIMIGNKTKFVIALDEVSVDLGDVIVVGYGVQKKESVVGAITQVNSAALVKSGISNVTNAISGKLSGVLTIQQAGEPGANASQIIIRGLSSWNGSQPLVLVDGVERDFKDLDPNEVATISVLKDASATAVFGAKGANGVIIVTTKRGTIGAPVMSFSASYGMQKATRIPKFIDSYTTMSAVNIGLMNGQRFDGLISQSTLNEYKNPSSPLKALQYPSVDWFKELTLPFSPTVDANFNISGGTKFVKYFGTLGFYNENTFFKGYVNGYDDTRYKYDRFNYRTNLDFNLTPTTTLSFNIGGETGIKNQPTNSPWRSMYTATVASFPTYYPAWLLEDKVNGIPDPDYPDATGDRLTLNNLNVNMPNPYTQLAMGNFNKYLRSKLFTDIFLDQKLNFIIKGLSLKGKVAFSTYYNTRTLYTDYTRPQYKINWADVGKPGVNPWYRNGQSGYYVYNLNPLDINVGGLEKGYYRDLYYEGSLNYANTFGRHRITALALINRQKNQAGTDFAFLNEALVGRATYDYSHKYLVEVNIGYTGSERFAPGNKFGFFPSGAFGWVVSEEPFFKQGVPFISKLKIRYSDGLVGSDAASARWLFMSNYYTDGNGYIREDPAANPVAQWEEARKKDIGLEIGFLKNDLTITIDLFDEHRTHMLLTPTIPMMVGNTFKDQNLGSMKKHGYDLDIEYKKSLTNDFGFFLKGIFGFNENRILYKDDPKYAPEYAKEQGKPLGGQIRGAELIGSGYFTSVDDIHTSAIPIPVSDLNVGDYKFLDYFADGKISILDRYPIAGSDYPPITYSFGGGCSYKNFDFSFNFMGNAGKYVFYNLPFEVEFINGAYRIHASQLDYWTPTNPDANHSTLHYMGDASILNLVWGGGASNAGSGYETLIQDRFWRKADYLRLKEVYIAYTFKPEFLKKAIGISGLSAYVTGNNLWTLTDLLEGDPERKDFTQGFYPQMSSIKIGLKIGF
ncbi:MAG: SusC/RagA family TonB-linked outer membrane protein [Bacteroidetes bacterium]|nr:SusC/RagA family TonB-linked outer membrane protein [Bacteroidota bacterium]